MDQPGKVANPARGQLNRENSIPLSPCVPENLVSRDGFSRPVPRHRFSTSILESPLALRSMYQALECNVVASGEPCINRGRVSDQFSGTLRRPEEVAGQLENGVIFQVLLLNWWTMFTPRYVALRDRRSRIYLAGDPR